MKKYSLYILLAGLIIMLGGCSTKKNTPLSRKYNAFTTRYNVHFNGDEAYKDALKDMQESYDDDFSGMIFMHPVSSLAELEEVKGNAKFDRAIEKAQKSIKTKSIKKRPVKNQKKMRDEAYKEYLKRGEYNPFMHNSWLMMGRAQFFKGDFLAANATFLYITRNFSWLPETINESYIWMARGYAEMGWLYEAENTLAKVEQDKLPNYLKNLYATAYSNLLIRQGANAEAIPYLKTAVAAEKNKTQKARMTYLLAQLYESQNQDALAYTQYGKVIGMNTNYRISFNAQIGQTDVMPKNNLKKIESKLKKMERDPRNKEYLDQVFYAKGNLCLLQNDTLKAIDAFKCAVDSSVRGGMEKAVAAIKLGDLCFEREDYLKAQPAFATAISILPAKHKEYERVSRLSTVLDKLKDYAETVHLQDSLITLVNMPEAERMKVIDAAIKEVIRQEKLAEQEERRQQYESDRENNNLNNNNKNQITTPTINNGDNSWYFYNATSLKNGKTEFQRRWGARKQEDNWRRKDKTEVYFDEPETEENMLADNNVENNGSFIDNDNVIAEKEAVTEDNKDPKYYLAQLPFSEEEQLLAHTLIEESLFEMGIIFCRDLENLNVSIKTLMDVERRYPESLHMLDIYYEIYLMYMRMNDTYNASVYKNKIISTFPESSYAIALSDPNYIEKLRNMDKLQEELYAETYQCYLDGNTSKVHANYEFVKANWPLSKLMPKFMFLDALSYVPENRVGEFKTTLEQLTATYCESDVAPLAGLMIKGLAEGRNLEGGGMMRGMIWDTKFAFEGSAFGGDSIMNSFTDNKDVPHLFVLAFRTDSVNSNNILFDIAKYNFSNYLVKDFDLETITFNELSMIVIKGFDRFDELVKYRKGFSSAKGVLLPACITPVMISDDNFRLLLQGRSFAEYFSFMEENAAEDAEKPAIGLESQNTDPAEQPVLKDVNKDTELEVIDDKDLENVPLENNRIEITE